MTKLYVTEEEREADMLPKTNKVSCLGPDGSYSRLAAEQLCKGEEIVLCHSFGESVNKLLAGETDHAVLPVENSINGGILTVLDLLARTSTPSVPMNRHSTNALNISVGPSRMRRSCRLLRQRRV